MPRDSCSVSRRSVRITIVLLAYGAVLAMGAAFGAISVVELRRTAGGLEAVIYRSAEIVIAVERLHATNDHLGMSARNFLLTGNDESLRESRDKAEELRARLRELARQIDDPRTTRMLERIRDLDRQEREDMEVLFAARRHLSEAELAELVEQRAQPLRARVGDMIEELSHAQGAAFLATAHDAQVAVTRATRSLAALGAVALLLAGGLTFALVRALRLLGRGRAALEQANERLERANRDLDAFAGRIAHDLRNAIAPFGLLADALEHGPTDAQAVRGAAQRMQRLTRNADNLIGALLDFARTGGEAQDTRVSASVPEVLRDVLADLGARAEASRATVQVEADEVSVRCPRSLLQIVLMNLVENALKYLDGEERTVRIACCARADRCEITVADTGPGIPADALEYIFQPFYRVPGVAAPGTGIGLATVARIVEGHHGDISVRSTVGQGTRFVVRLPIAPPGGDERTSASMARL